MKKTILLLIFVLTVSLIIVSFVLTSGCHSSEEKKGCGKEHKVKNEKAEEKKEEQKKEALIQTYSSPEAKIGDKVICPVMGATITVTEETKYAKVDSKKYYVCCPGCVKKIEDNPDKYLKDKEKEDQGGEE